jgi:hypothetical protein
MRSISAALSTHLNGSALTLASMVKITRQDGTVLGFSSADVNLVFGGVTYHADSAFDPSSLRGQLASGVDNLSVVGMLKSPYITDTDLLAGQYDGAQVELFLVNYMDLSQGKMVLLTGYLGDATLEDGKWTIEFRSISQLTGQQIGELTSPSCRVLQFGDERCSRAGGNVLAGGHELSGDPDGGDGSLRHSDQLRRLRQPDHVLRVRGRSVHVGRERRHQPRDPVAGFFTGERGGQPSGGVPVYGSGGGRCRVDGGV